MEVGQPMDSQASTITENPSSGIPAEHTGAATLTESGGEQVAPESLGGVVYASGDGSNIADENMHGQGINNVTQDAAQAAAYESNSEVVADGTADNGVNHENLTGMHASVGYDSMNGNAGELGTHNYSGAAANGHPSNEVMASAAEQHFEDVNSAEEGRLWSMVRANCLDFNAWTALIEETEKVAENNILKIRKVYDAFLAEFPLCYGYWKKYADHEGLLGSVDKVVEVYERAVHAVTYSVDIWLHYCVFAISTYDDPDTIRSGTHISGGKVIKLYERCLIACANYPEFWTRYVLSMEYSGNMELAYNALARASHVFVKKQPEIHLFAAKFKEMCEDFAGARTEYQFIYSEISPCLLEAIIKHANMEYRLGNREVAYSIYEEIIATEKDKEQSQILPMLLVQYSRFLYLVAGNLEKAWEVLFGSLDQVQLSKPLLEAVIHLEAIQPHAKHIDYLDTLVERFISPAFDNTGIASPTDREEISCIFMEFLDLFGDTQSTRKAYNRHMKLFLHQKRNSISKKRQAEDFLASDNTKLARPSADVTSSSQLVVGAYPNAQNQWAAGYGQRAPWPQNSQAQGQQWNPGYAPQPAYNAYGYANYAPPPVLVPTSAPQTAAYPYAPTYPVQAYPQQGYTQTSAASATFHQQQGAAPQPYYGTYY